MYKSSFLSADIGCVYQSRKVLTGGPLGTARYQGPQGASGLYIYICVAVIWLSLAGTDYRTNWPVVTISDRGKLLPPYTLTQTSSPVMQPESSVSFPFVPTLYRCKIQIYPWPSQLFSLLSVTEPQFSMVQGNTIGGFKKTSRINSHEKRDTTIWKKKKKNRKWFEATGVGEKRHWP